MENQQPNSTDAPVEPKDLGHLRQLARMLDSAIPLPGGFRIGLDGIIGLVPGIGDAIGASLSTYIVIRAAQMGASTLLLIRMMLNILLETLVGVVPIIGDLFDFAWKANDKNIRLLESQLAKTPRRGSARKRLTAATLLLLLVFIAILVGLLVLAFQLLLMMLQAIGG